jgi:hypothetical protein
MTNIQFSESSNPPDFKMSFKERLLVAWYGFLYLVTNNATKYGNFHVRSSAIVNFYPETMTVSYWRKTPMQSKPEHIALSAKGVEVTAFWNGIESTKSVPIKFANMYKFHRSHFYDPESPNIETYCLNIREGVVHLSQGAKQFRQ